MIMFKILFRMLYTIIKAVSRILMFFVGNSGNQTLFFGDGIDAYKFQYKDRKEYLTAYGFSVYKLFGGRVYHDMVSLTIWNKMFVIENDGYHYSRTISKE